MAASVSLNDITIRTQLKPGDLGYVIYRHGVLYNQEYGYGIDFESYVASGRYKFYQQYDPSKDRVWISEYRGTIIGFLLLIGRPNKTAQLRYFFLEPDFRGMGLGKKNDGIIYGFLPQL